MVADQCLINKSLEIKPLYKMVPGTLRCHDVENELESEQVM
jgi:hypothetical protein